LRSSIIFIGGLRHLSFNLPDYRRSHDHDSDFLMIEYLGNLLHDCALLDNLHYPNDIYPDSPQNYPSICISRTNQHSDLRAFAAAECRNESRLTVCVLLQMQKPSPLADPPNHSDISPKPLIFFPEPQSLPEFTLIYSVSTSRLAPNHGSTSGGNIDATLSSSCDILGIKGYLGSCGRFLTS
jgi:hypothetical protein